VDRAKKFLAIGSSGRQKFRTPQTGMFVKNELESRVQKNFEKSFLAPKRAKRPVAFVLGVIWEPPLHFSSARKKKFFFSEK
jgi:hypothetical protein